MLSFAAHGAHEEEELVYEIMLTPTSCRPSPTLRCSRAAGNGNQPLGRRPAASKRVEQTAHWMGWEMVKDA